MNIEEYREITRFFGRPLLFSFLKHRNRKNAIFGTPVGMKKGRILFLQPKKTSPIIRFLSFQNAENVFFCTRYHEQRIMRHLLSPEREIQTRDSPCPPVRDWCGRVKRFNVNISISNGAIFGQRLKWEWLCFSIQHDFPFTRKKCDFLGATAPNGKNLFEHHVSSFLTPLWRISYSLDKIIYFCLCWIFSEPRERIVVFSCF